MNLSFNPATLFGSVDKRDIELTSGGKVISVTGNYGLVSDGLKRLLDAGAQQPVGLISAGIRDDGQQVHIVLAEGTVQEVGAIDITKADDAKLKLEGYKYLDFNGTMRQRTNVFAIEAGFQPKIGAKAYGALAKAMLNGNEIRGSETGTRTQILAGRQGVKRELFVTKAGKKTLKLEMPNIENPRFALVQGHTVVAAEQGTDRIAALNVQQFDALFEDGQAPIWETALLDDVQIEDMSVEVNGTPTVALTYKKDDGKRYYGFATVRWSEQDGAYGDFRLQVHTDAVDTDKMGAWTPAIERIEPSTGVVATRDTNGSAQLIKLGSLERFGVDGSAKPTWDQMVTKAADGHYAAAA